MFFLNFFKKKRGCYWIYGLSYLLTSKLAFASPHAQVELPSGEIRNIEYEQRGQLAITEEDILIGKITPNSYPKAMIISKIGGGRWSDGVVPFEMAPDLPLVNKIAVLEAIEHWQKRTHVEFVERTQRNYHQFPDYVLFAPASGTTCASFVGKVGGGQIVSLSPRCNKMITVHEIGHALGLWHEQSRMDRDSYIRILWENIDEPHRFNFEQHLNEGRDFGEYDYQSIMHYAPYAFSKNGLPTLVPLQEGVEIGQRREITAKDIAAVNAMYPGV